MRTALLMLVTWVALSATVGTARKETVPLNPATAGSSASELALPVRLPYEKRLPGAITDYVMLTFTSPWGREYLMQETLLPYDGFRYVQKSGRSCQGIKPYCMLYDTKTQRGIAVSVAYSGNWQIEVKPQGDQTLLAWPRRRRNSRRSNLLAASPFPGPSSRNFLAIGTTAPSPSCASFAATCCEV